MNNYLYHRYKETKFLIEEYEQQKEQEANRELYDGWIEYIQKMNEIFPAIEEEHKREKAICMTFTPEQIDHICYQIGEWYLHWKDKILVDGKPNQHRLGIAKEYLKNMICGD